MTVDTKIPRKNIRSRCPSAATLFVVMMTGTTAGSRRREVIKMGPYQVYQFYEAERTKSAAERRAADLRAGMLAAEAAQFGHDLSTVSRAIISYVLAPWRGLRRHATAPAVESAAHPRGNGVCPTPVQTRTLVSSGACRREQTHTGVAHASRW